MRLLPPLWAFPAAQRGLPPLQKGRPCLLGTATESPRELHRRAGPWGLFPGLLDALPGSEGQGRFLLGGGGLPQGPLLAAAAPNVRGAGLSAQLCDSRAVWVLVAAARSSGTRAGRLRSSRPTQGAPACPPGTPRLPLQEECLTMQAATPRCPAAVPPDARTASGPQDAPRPGQLFQPPVCHGGTCFTGNLTMSPKGL